LSGYCDVSVHNNAKTTRADRSLREGIQAQLRLLAHLAGVLWKWRPGIVHIHTCSEFTFWRNGLDVLLSKLFGKRVLLHIHGARFHEFLGSLSPLRAWIARRILSAADRVIVLGKVWEERLAGWCATENIVIVPNGVLIPADGRQEHAPGCSIVCVANYERRKGLEDLVRAAALVQPPAPVRLTLLGTEVDAGYRQHLERVAIELGIGERVSIPGPVPFDQVARHFQSADVFSLPSYNEGLPMALLEAMANGLPVVATRVGAIPEVVQEGVEGYLYEPGDVPALAAFLERLLSDPAMARRMGACSRNRVAQEFGVEAMAGRIFELYQEVLPPGTGIRARLHHAVGNNYGF
jgi:glycosyltransferase involved in cell wall biosynthesis